MKKLLSLILAIALVLSLVPAVFAAEGEATEKTELRIKYDILGAVKKLGVSWESSVGVDGEKRVPFTNIDFALTDGFFSFKDSSCGIFTGHSELNYNNICGFQISSNDWIEFDIYVPKAGTYTMEMWCGTYTSDTRTKVYVNGTEVGEFSNYEENAPALTKVVDVPRYIEGITFEKAGIHTVRFFGTSDYCTAGTFYLVDSNAGASLSLATIVADIDKDILSCGAGETAIIETSLYMNDGSAVSDASAYPVSFKSDNEAVASVSEDGVVTPGAAGKAKITAYATNEFGEEVYAIKEISVVDGAVIKYDINKHLFTDLGYTDSTSVEEGSLTRLDETVTDGFYSYLGGMDYDRNYIKYSHGAGIIQLMSTGTKISFKVYVPIAGSYRVEADTLEVNTDRCDVDINVYITKDAANEYPKNLVGGYNAYNASATAAKSVRKSIGQYNFTEPGYYVINFVLAKGYQATSGSPYSFVGNFYLIGGANSTIMNGKITSSTSSINVDEGETAEVVATGFVSSTTEAATFTYSSSNTAVATVDSESGVVTPVAEGVAIITATSNADLANTLTTEIEVTCNKPGEAIADTKVNFMASAEEGGTVTDNKLVKEVAIGSNVTVEATANDGYEFAYWRNASGKHLSSNAKETFKVNTNTAVIAVFDKVEVEETDTEVPVYFYNENGSLIEKKDVTKGITFAEAANGIETSLTGHIFKEWSISGETVINGILRAVALYDKNETVYNVTVGGNVVASGKYGDEVTVTGSDSFKAWKLGENVVSYDKEYSFYIWGNVALTEVTEGEVTVVPTVAIDNSGDSYFISYNVPEGYTLIEAGIVFAKGGKPEIGSFNSKAVAKAGSGQFTAKKGEDTETVARGYVLFRDGDGIRVIYAD